MRTRGLVCSSRPFDSVQTILDDSNGTLYMLAGGTLFDIPAGSPRNPNGFRYSKASGR